MTAAPSARAGALVVDPDAACRRAAGAGLIIRQADPLNAETPLSLLAGKAVGHSDRFYVRNHFGIPALDHGSWRLRVGGLAGRSLSLSLAELRSLPSQTALATLECAGNGRSGMEPPVPGEPWDVGAVGTAAWTGVPLAEVLARAAPRPAAREVVFRGADSGRVSGRAGPVHFERSLPLRQACSAEPLLAYAMNGAPLPAQHGYPLRLIVPGWYGVASVKWLTDIELTSEAFAGHFQVYRYQIGGQPLTRQAVRSVITEPRAGDTVQPGEISVRGLAWSGAAPIVRVEVRIGGQPWQEAVLTGRRHRYAWRSWELSARVGQPGSVTVLARATDTIGRTQPSQPAWNPLGYASNAIHQIRISVALLANGITAPPRAAGGRHLRPAQPHFPVDALPSGQEAPDRSRIALSHRHRPPRS
jgi:DMSO/TMAO reductase YedYZ molybdopterin-dependent catalytic subunit